MAYQPITWKNVDAPNLTQAGALLGQAGQNIAQGFNTLSNLGQNIQQTNIARQEGLVKQDTDAVLAGLANIRDMASYDQAIQEGTYTPENIAKMAPNADVGVIIKALEAKDNELRSEASNALQDTFRQGQINAQTQEASLFDLRKQTAEQQLTNAQNQAEADKTQSALNALRLEEEQRKSNLARQAEETAQQKIQAEELFKQQVSVQADSVSAFNDFLTGVNTNEFSDDPSKLFTVDSNFKVNFTSAATDADKQLVEANRTLALSSGLSEVTDETVLTKYAKALQGIEGLSADQIDSLVAAKRNLLAKDDTLNDKETIQYNKSIAVPEAQYKAEIQVLDGELATVEKQYPTSIVEATKDTSVTFGSALGSVRKSLDDLGQQGDEVVANLNTLVKGLRDNPKQVAFASDYSFKNIDGEGVTTRLANITDIPGWALDAAQKNVAARTPEDTWYSWEESPADLAKAIYDEALYLTEQNQREVFNTDLINKVKTDIGLRKFDLERRFDNEKLRIQENILGSRNSK